MSVPLLSPSPISLSLTALSSLSLHLCHHPPVFIFCSFPLSLTFPLGVSHLPKNQILLPWDWAREPQPQSFSLHPFPHLGPRAPGMGTRSQVATSKAHREEARARSRAFHCSSSGWQLSTCSKGIPLGVDPSAQNGAAKAWPISRGNNLRRELGHRLPKGLQPVGTDLGEAGKEEMGRRGSGQGLERVPGPRPRRRREQIQTG